MCGVFGWQFTTMPTSSDMVVLATTLSALNDERGGDSWGIASPNGLYERGLGLLANSRGPRMLAEQSNVIAHTRFKTMGGVTIENAHPYKFDSLIGAHNGCIFNSSDLDRKYSRQFAVDSMHLISHIKENRWPMTDLFGYGTVEYFFTDDEERGIYLGSFEGGDLTVARVKNHGLIWSSARRHLEMALHIAEMSGTIISLKEARVYRLVEGKIFKTNNSFKIERRYVSTTTRQASRFQGANSPWCGGIYGMDDDDDNYYVADLRSSRRTSSKASSTPQMEPSLRNTKIVDGFKPFHVKPSFYQTVEDWNGVLFYVEKDRLTLKTNATRYVPDWHGEISQRDSKYLENIDAIVGECALPSCQHSPNYQKIICVVCGHCMVCCSRAKASKEIHDEFDKVAEEEKEESKDDPKEVRLDNFCSQIGACAGCNNNIEDFCVNCSFCDLCCNCTVPRLWSTVSEEEYEEMMQS